MQTKVKRISVFAIGLILMASIGTAALLASYGTVTGTANVEQGVTVEGDLTYIIGDSPAQAGNTYLDGVFSVINHAENPTEVQLSTRCKNSVDFDDGAQTNMYINWSDGIGNNKCDGIVTSYFGTLDLTTKNTQTWVPTETMKATIYYTLVGEDFVVSGVPEGYTLVYYPNTIGGFANNVANAIAFSEGSNPSTPNLPIPADVGDDYCGNGFNPNAIHCSGAKLWLIPGDAQQAIAKLTIWSNPETYLFETDLVSYTESDDNIITLPANGGGFNFVVKNELDIALVPDVYTITTNVIPAMSQV